MSSKISHKGVVTGSGKGFITVNIAPELSDCKGCAISAMCRKSENMTVPYSGDGSSLIGKHVTISAPVGLQRGAIVMLLVVPLVLLVGVLMLLLSFGMGEAWSSVCALAAVALWYLIIFISPPAPPFKVKSEK